MMFASDIPGEHHKTPNYFLQLFKEKGPAFLTENGFDPKTMDVYPSVADNYPEVYFCFEFEDGLELSMSVVIYPKKLYWSGSFPANTPKAQEFNPKMYALIAEWTK